MKKLLFLFFLFITTSVYAQPSIVPVPLRITDDTTVVNSPFEIGFSGGIVSELASGGALVTITGASGAPATADYLVGTSNASLSAEIIVGTTPGGELGGTWASPTIDDGVTVDTWVLGDSTATTINKVTITAPASGSTLTVADGKTLTATNTVNLNTMTDEYICNYEGTGTQLNCDYLTDASGECAASSVCMGGHTHAGGGGFAMQLDPKSAKLPASNPMGIDAGNLQWRGLFDDTTDECARWQGILTPYTSGLDIDIVYSLETTSTSDIVELEVYVMCGKTDADMDTDSFDTVNNLSSGSVSTTAGYSAVLTATLSNIDSCAEDNLIIIKICRDADDTDTTADDVEFRGASLHE